VTVRARPTQAQLLVLHAAADGALRRSEAGYELYRPYATGSYGGAVIQKRTVDRCVENGWVVIGGRDRATLSRPIEITAAGHAVLAANRSA
jgi:hypothetical protein